MAGRSLRPEVMAVLVAAALIAAVLIFRQLTGLLIAIMIMILVAIPLSALADRLERHGVPRTASVVGGLIAGLALVGGILALVVPALVDQTDQFIDSIPSSFDSLQRQIGGLVDAEPGAVGDEVQSYLQGLIDQPSRIIGPLASLGLTLFGLLGILVLILITAAYVAINPRPLIDAALSLMPPRRRDEGQRVMDRLREAWIGWMQGVGVDMVTSGTLLFIGLTLVGLEFAVVFAVFSALLVVIPYFGAIIGGIPPVLFALTDSPGKALIVLAIYIFVQLVEGNLIIPLVMAERVNLHPAVVAIGVVIVGQLIGLLGLFVAVPIISLIVILTQELWVNRIEDGPGADAATARAP